MKAKPVKQPSLDRALRDVALALKRLEQVTGGTYTVRIEWTAKEQTTEVRKA